MSSLIEIINNISEEAKNQFKPDLKKYGKNFRAISESAVLEVLNPLFKKYNIGYQVIIKDKNLHIEKVKAGRDGAGNIIEKLVFVADATVSLKFYQTNEYADGPFYSGPIFPGEFFVFEGWGSGVDAGDKATGKAITAAVKYALFKGFRLQYSDDPDAEASEDIETIVEESKKESAAAKKEKKEEEPLATEKMLNYVMGLASDLKLSDSDFKAEFGFFPYETKVEMRKVREAIDKLKARKEDLPF
jgi:hypothetical protein